MGTMSMPDATAVLRPLAAAGLLALTLGLGSAAAFEAPNTLRGLAEASAAAADGIHRRSRLGFQPALLGC